MVLTTNETKSLINNILIDWNDFIERIQNYKEEGLADDLFAQIDFLAQVDALRGRISSQLSRLEEYAPDWSRVAIIENFPNIFVIESKLKIAGESCDDVADNILSQCVDRIYELTEQILEHRQTPPVNREGLELEAENELRELRDSLETYREIRFESIVEDTEDPIIRQLDSQILACGSALMIDETSL